MAKFTGTTNLVLGSPPWAVSAYDPDSGGYVVEVSGTEDVKRFRACAADYGYTEVKSGRGEEKSEQPEKAERAE